jgi:hypothetical protein
MGNPVKSLNDSDMVTVRDNSRRTFLRVLGMTLTGATAAITGPRPSRAGDFPKGTRDADVTENADLKATDSDEHNSKAVDGNQNRLRDVRSSTNAD